jgi:hypothetical protein
MKHWTVKGDGAKTIGTRKVGMIIVTGNVSSEGQESLL